jgi:hypothetical protein
MYVLKERAHGRLPSGPAPVPGVPDLHSQIVNTLSGYQITGLDRKVLDSCVTPGTAKVLLSLLFPLLKTILFMATAKSPPAPFTFIALLRDETVKCFTCAIYDIWAVKWMRILVGDTVFSDLSSWTTQANALESCYVSPDSTLASITSTVFPVIYSIRQYISFTKLGKKAVTAAFNEFYIEHTTNQRAAYAGQNGKYEFFEDFLVPGNYKLQVSQVRNLEGKASGLVNLEMRTAPVNTRPEVYTCEGLFSRARDKFSKYAARKFAGYVNKARSGHRNRY